MAGVSGWYSTPYECAEDPSLSHGVGWYQDGQLLASTYQNPATGVAYTPQELQALAGGTTPTGTPGTTPTGAPGTTPTANLPTYQEWLNTNYPGATTTPEQLTGAHQEYLDWVTSQGGTIGADAQTPPTMSGVGTQPPGYIPGQLSPHIATTPTFGEGAAADIPLPEVTPAPPYEKTPEQIAFEGMYAGKLTDWVEEGGYGIPEETQAQMIQQQTDSLKARETESLRVMKNTMERRGLTNSGLIFANEQAIRSGTSVAIAGAIADVQIKSALIKLASFENAMGQAGQFLNYLSTQSQLAYQPEFATWQAQQMAKMQQWQGQLDLLKMEINQAYQTQNLTLQSQLQGQLDAQQHQYDVELMEMEIEANQQAATAEGWGGLLGTIFGWLFSWL